MRIDETDFTSFTLGQRIRHLEVEGYVVLPDMLDAQQIARLDTELANVPMQHKDYSEAQTYAMEPQWLSRSVAEPPPSPTTTSSARSSSDSSARIL